MGMMTSNPKDERLIRGQGLHVAILFAGDLTKQEVTSPNFG
jgi:hypothetical protein